MHFDHTMFLNIVVGVPNVDIGSYDSTDNRVDYNNNKVGRNVDNHKDSN